MKFVKKIYNKIFVYFKLLAFNLGIGMRNVENDILKNMGGGSINEKNKKETRRVSHSQLLEKFYQGVKDEKYVKDYYEILKKADTFIERSTNKQYGATADKLGMNYGKKDIHGLRHEHYGFFDEKSKHYGKTLGEVIKSEMKERATKDDNYEIIYIHNNLPTIKHNDIIDTLLDNMNKDDYSLNMDKNVKVSLSQKAKFNLKIVRENDNVINKIEQLTDYVHVKKVSEEYRQLEFFVNNKFGLYNFDDDSDIFNEIIDIDEVWFTDKYGDVTAYKINNYKKRLDYDDNYEVIKFFCKEMEVIKVNNI